MRQIQDAITHRRQGTQAKLTERAIAKDKQSRYVGFLPCKNTFKPPPMQPVKLPLSEVAKYGAKVIEKGAMVLPRCRLTSDDEKTIMAAGVGKEIIEKYYRLGDAPGCCGGCKK